MSIFLQDDYKAFVRDFIASQPRKGRGMSRRIAEHLNIHPAMVSQIFSGSRELTPEQALDLAGFMGLSELEANCFLLLVQIERAGTHRLRETYRQQLRGLQAQAQELKNRLPKDVELNEQARAQFYSGWQYSGVRLASSLAKLNTAQDIAQYLGISPSVAARTLEFLLGTGLCVRHADGHLDIGPKRTHLEATSPLIQQHHRNWRLKALQRMEAEDDTNLYYSGPMSLSRAALGEVRELLIQLLSQVRSKAESSEADALACLNLDLFTFGQN